MRSNSSSDWPVLANKFVTAIRGASNSIPGSFAACEYPVIRATGPLEQFAAKASFETTTAAAPSLIDDALPAVTVIPGGNTVRRAERPSRVVSARGPSSVTNVVTLPRPPFTLTGVISSENNPSADAFEARRWLRSENSSC